MIPQEGDLQLFGVPEAGVLDNLPAAEDDTISAVASIRDEPYLLLGCDRCFDQTVDIRSSETLTKSHWHRVSTVRMKRRACPTPKLCWSPLQREFLSMRCWCASRMCRHSRGCRSGDLKLAALLDEDGQLAFLPAHIRRLESHIYQGELQLPHGNFRCPA